MTEGTETAFALSREEHERMVATLTELAHSLDELADVFASTGGVRDRGEAGARSAAASVHAILEVLADRSRWVSLPSPSSTTP